ncbi:hypothetical protein BX600DRAFT_443488 [Xylariales sp. PMI_506]|nr:hypothetical protein BX600DRAFT_443488 [Xylariales sp. PMI_506]
MALHIDTGSIANQQRFFNLSKDRNAAYERSYFGAPALHTISTNWWTFVDQPLTAGNVIDLFANRIPVIRQKGFLQPEELSRMLDILKTHEFGEYDTAFTWPRVGVAGITQYDHLKGKLLFFALFFFHIHPSKYFQEVSNAMSLQRRWKSEAGIDVVARVMETLSKMSGIPVRRARDGEREFFAGVLRAVNHGIGIHADYAPYEAADWSIDKIVAQLTWNILLNEVPGGDTLIYDRQWRAPDDDEAWRKEIPCDSYHPQMLERHPFKSMRAVPGDLTFFNPRNFHEVKACDTDRDHPVAATRFTVSSFIGYMPPQEDEPATLILWS